MESSLLKQPIPFDVLEAIVDEITALGSRKEVESTLRAFCLLSKQCVPLAQKHIFASITIAGVDVSQWDPWLPPPEKLYALLQSNAYIALYVQKVTLFHYMPTIVREDPRLPELLLLLKRVKSFRLLRITHGRLLDWSDISPETRAAVYTLMQSKSMESLSLSGFDNIPIQMAPSMLRLNNISVVSWFQSERRPIAPNLSSERPSLISLIFSGYVDFPVGLVDLRSLRTFKCAPLNISCLSNALHLITSPPAQSLDRVTFDLFETQYILNSPDSPTRILAREFNLNLFPSLRVFTIKTLISQISSGLFLANIARVLYSSPQSGSKLEEFEVILDDNLEQTEKYVPYVSKAEWKHLDEAITSQRFCSMRRVVFKVILDETRAKEFDLIQHAITIRFPLVSTSSSRDLLF